MHLEVMDSWLWLLCVFVVLLSLAERTRTVNFATAILLEEIATDGMMSPE